MFNSDQAAEAARRLKEHLEGNPAYMNFMEAVSRSMKTDISRARAMWGEGKEAVPFEANEVGDVVVFIDITTPLDHNGHGYINVMVNDEILTIDHFSAYCIKRDPDFLKKIGVEGEEFPLILDIMIGIEKKMFESLNKNDNETFDLCAHYMSNIDVIMSAIFNGPHSVEFSIEEDK